MYLEDDAIAAAISGDVTKFPFSEICKQDMSETFRKVTPSGNSLLHIAARSGKADLTGLMASNLTFMMTMKNCKGDTALHVASKSGMINTVRKIVDCAKASGLAAATDDNSLLEMKNERGNTALHEALFALLDAIEDKKLDEARRKEKVASVVAVARCLVSAHPNTSYLQNNAGISPMCLAVESGDKDILEYILTALPKDDNCVAKLKGKSPVQVAIEKRTLDMLKIMEKEQPNLLLIRDKEGNTPMHWAASKGYEDGVRHIYNINRNNAVQRNNKSLYPLHLACQNDRVGVMDELLTKWPDPTELYNYKGQNILHVAAKNGKVQAVRHILKTNKKLVNEVDGDGNTSLHLAALYGHIIVVGDLIMDGRVKLNTENNVGLTAYHIAEQQCAILNPELSSHPHGQGQKNDKDANSESSGDKNGKQSKSEQTDPKKGKKSESELEVDIHITGQGQKNDNKNDQDSNLESSGHKNGSHAKPQPTDSKKEKESESEPEPDIYTTMMTLAVLFTVHNICILFSGDTFAERCSEVVNNLKKNTRQKPRKEDINTRITNLLVVAALIAGAAFAGSVQIGSSNSDTSSVPAPAPSPKADRKETALTFFTVCNTAGMYTSITAAIILCWAQLQDTNLASVDVWIASLLVAFALYMSCFAFFATVYMVTDLDNSFILTMMVIQALFLWFLSIRSFQLIVPFRLKKLFILYVYLYQAIIYYFLYSFYLFCCKYCRCCRCCCCGSHRKEWFCVFYCKD